MSVTAQALNEEQLSDTFIDSAYEAAQRVEKIVELPFDDLTNGDLVTVYRLVNETRKMSDKARDKAKASITNRFKVAATEGEDGELTLPDIAPEDITQVDGILRITNKDGESVEFRPRTKLQFLHAVAAEILEDKGLLALATDRTVVVTDVEAIQDAISKAVLALQAAGEDKAANTLVQTYDAATEVRESVSEAKVEALVKDDKLDLEDAEKMYENKTSYALYG